MSDIINQILNGKLWSFNGGIHPPEMKEQSNYQPLRSIDLPKAFILPLQQHIGSKGELLVKIGDRVLKGQPLTSKTEKALPIHAPTSGLITHIDLYTTAHPSGLNELCIRLEPDGLDLWGNKKPQADYTQLTPEYLVDLIQQAGIAGLGGAAFPTARKLKAGLDKVEILIINGAECEPYITADDRLMREHATEIITGCEILCHILKPKLTIIAIEDNKPEAIDAIKQALSENNNIILRVIPTKYPSGGAKQLTKILTGQEIPFGHHSADIGILMQNVGTAFAVKRAIIDGEPLIERVVTLTGDNVTNKGNFWVRLGTPVSHLLNVGQYHPLGKDKTPKMVIMGGPMMGFTLPHFEVPILKISSCILVPSNQELSAPAPEQACIRCTLCVDACPAGLLPQQLYWFSKGQEHEKARQYHLFDCIECGACAYVCPSNIPLVQYYRQEKAEIRELDNATALAQQAKNRFEAKQARLANEKLARQEKHKQAAVKVGDSDRSIIDAALERLKTKQVTDKVSTEPQLIIHTIDDSVLPDNSAVINARAARKELARQRKAERDPIEQSANSVNQQQIENIDPRKAAVAEAIARAKAKKAALQADSTQAEPVTTTPANNDTIDPRKAAVAEAIARAKAKKAALQTGSTQAEPVTTTPANNDTIDPRKAAVAEAIARAKAKKAALQAGSTQAEPVTTTPANNDTIDPRKAAVAEAIARAKAKKAERNKEQLSSKSEE